MSIWKMFQKMMTNYTLSKDVLLPWPQNWVSTHQQWKVFFVSEKTFWKTNYPRVPYNNPYKFINEADFMTQILLKFLNWKNGDQTVYLIYALLNEWFIVSKRE